MKIFKDHSFHGFLFGLLFSATMIFGSSFAWMPSVIDKDFPVVGDIKVEDAVRTPDGMNSFYLTVQKFRMGKPALYAFFIEDSLHQRTAVAAFKGNDDCTKEKPTNSNRLIEHIPPQKWTYHYCFQMAKDTESLESYRIVGIIQHSAFPYIYGPTTAAIDPFSTRSVDTIPSEHPEVTIDVGAK